VSEVTQKTHSALQPVLHQLKELKKNMSVSQDKPKKDVSTSQERLKCERVPSRMANANSEYNRHTTQTFEGCNSSS
jgi:hypothetical protein